jgi:hypothetical protein
MVKTLAPRAVPAAPHPPLCRQNYESSPWIKFLLDERMLVVVPFANADGFTHSKREVTGHAVGDDDIGVGRRGGRGFITYISARHGAPLPRASQ